MGIPNIDLFRPVYFFAGGLYDKVDDKLKYKLIKNNGKLKNFMVVDITHDKILTRDQFLEENCDKDPVTEEFIYDANDIISSIDYLSSARYKVFRKIKIGEEIL